MPKKPQVYYVHFIITSKFLLLIVLMYWNLSHNILNNYNTRYRNQNISIVHVYLTKISLKMALVERAETRSWKDIILINHLTECCVKLHFIHFIFPYYAIETQVGCLTWEFYTLKCSAWYSAKLRYSLDYQSVGRL
jgi:hypothetical protein